MDFSMNPFVVVRTSSACFSHMSRSGVTPLAAKESMARVKISSTCGSTEKPSPVVCLAPFTGRSQYDNISGQIIVIHKPEIRPFGDDSHIFL